MSTKCQTCPVCGLTNIEDEKNKCPQCGADFSCFRVLDSLSEDIEPKESRVISEIPVKLDALFSEVTKIQADNNSSRLLETKSRTFLLGFLALAFLLLFAIGGFFFIIYSAFNRIEALDLKISRASEKREKQIRDVFNRYSELDKKFSIKILKNELKVNKQFDANNKKLLAQIEELSTKNQEMFKKIQTNLEKNSNDLTSRQKQLIDELRTQLEDTNSKVEKIQAEIVLILKKIADNRKDKNNSLNLKLEEQQAQLVNLLIIMNKALLKTEQTNNRILKVINDKSIIK